MGRVRVRVRVSVRGLPSLTLTLTVRYRVAEGGEVRANLVRSPRDGLALLGVRVRARVRVRG